MASKISILAKALFGYHQHREARRARKQARALVRAMATGCGADSLLPSTITTANARFDAALALANFPSNTKYDLCRQFNNRCYFNYGVNK